ncbi:MAG: CPBP family intramembrane metalloprotease [Alphaproteobacteria bacterium]|nr:CPBP family intramembrane metalloprotease [Alphaproteobacteria bacterium]
MPSSTPAASEPDEHEPAAPGTDIGDRPTDTGPAARRSVLVELTILWLVTMLGIRGVVAAQKGLGLPEWVMAAVPLMLIYVPVGLCHLRKVDSWGYRLSIPAFSDLAAWRKALGLAGAVMAMVLIPWLPLYHGWQVLLFDHHPGAGWRHGAAAGLAGVGQAPPELVTQAIALVASTPHAGTVLLAVVQVLTLVAYQLFFVAIPEEFFYRGYVQTRLNEHWPRRFLIFGTPMGWGSVMAALYFAFGHSLVEVHWWHFATFFPGMVFAWMRERTGGVVAGAVFHAACNITVVLLDGYYGVPRAF